MTVDEFIASALPSMATEVVAQARRLRIDSPLCRLKFWYYDTCAPSCYLLGDALRAADRERIVATEGINAGDQLWDGSGPIEISVGLSDDSPCTSVLAKAYNAMCMDASELHAAGLPESAAYMSRWLAQSLSRYLNEPGWDTVCPVTDDFIVYAQNGTDYGCDCYEDIVASVPSEKLDLLRSRGFLGHGDYYSDIAATSETPSEMLPARWVNSFAIRGTPADISTYRALVDTECGFLKKAELVSRDNGQTILTLHHDDALDSDKLESLAARTKVAIVGKVARTDIWG